VGTLRFAHPTSLRLRDLKPIAVRDLNVKEPRAELEAYDRILAARFASELF
jgi:hypothetical protein